MDYLMQMLQQQGIAFKIMPKNPQIQTPPNYIVADEELNFYSDEIKSIYLNIFKEGFQIQQEENQSEPKEVQSIELQKILNFQPKQTPMPVCHKIFGNKQTVFRCYDCSNHQSSIICIQCFEKANHKGHRYAQQTITGGICDCGNTDVIHSQGFCINHPGKAEPVIINPQEQNHFNHVIGIILQWMFRLYEKGHTQAADYLGQLLTVFLMDRNDKSLYYNTLTYGLLFSKRIHTTNENQRDCKIIDKIFEYGVYMKNFAEKITQLFFSMFSLQVFKYELTVSFAEAYNKIVDFELSKFKQLYVQIFAHNENIQKMVDERKLVLYPQKLNYRFINYMDDLNFVSSMKRKEVASKYYALLVEKGFVRFPLLTLIEKKVETEKVHIVNFLNSCLNDENKYYILNQTIVRFIQNNPKSLAQMFSNYADALMDDNFSYHYNNIIKPFHRVLAIIIVALSKGDLRNLNFQSIQKLIGRQMDLADVCIKSFMHIMQCFRQFARTFIQTSYFDNYIPLYIKSGKIIAVYDLFMFSFCIQIFQKENRQEMMNQMLFLLFQIKYQYRQKMKQQAQTQKNLTQNQTQKNEQNRSSKEKTLNFNHEELYRNNVQDEQKSTISIFKLKTYVELIKIMIQGCISQRPEIVIANNISISHETLDSRTQQLFVSVMNNFNDISPQNLESLNDLFLAREDFSERFVRHFLIYDKFKKKFILNQSQKFSRQKAPLFLYPSIKKFGGVFSQQPKESFEQSLMNIILSKQKIQKLKFLFNDQFLNQLSEKYICQLTKANNLENEEIHQVFLNYVKVIKTLRLMMRNQTPKYILEFYRKIQHLSQKLEFAYLKENIVQNSPKKERMQAQKINSKLKFEEKKKKKLEKIKKMQQSYTEVLQQKLNEKIEDESTCMICRQNNNESLCFLAKFNYANTLYAFTQVNGRYLVFHSCFHPIHIKCFFETSNHQFLRCPLCKNFSTIVLPFEKNLSDLKTISEVYERIITIRAVIGEHYQKESFDKNYETFGVLNLLRALAFMVERNLFKNESILNQKDQKLANTLYEMTKTVALQLLSQNDREKQMKIMDDFLEHLRKKIQQQKDANNNLYAMEYVILKIFKNCFTQNPMDCLQILNQNTAELINRNDLRKIWQMCDQIVSLPNYIIPQQSYPIKEISSTVDFYNPPETIFELIKERDSVEMSCKNGHQMCICIICKVKCCYDCSELQRHFRQIHYGDGVSFDLLTSKLMYSFNGKLLPIPTFYSNETGAQWKPSKSSDGFLFDKQTYKELKLAILDETADKFFKQRYPDLFNTN